MRRRFMVGGLGVIAVAALTLSGCSGGSSGGDSGGPVTITYATEAPANIFKQGEGALIKKFEASNPDIKVKVENIPFKNYNTKLLTEFRGGRGPDVGRVNNTDILTFNSGGFLSPLDSAIKRDNLDLTKFIPATVKMGNIKGKQMAMPMNVGARVLFYNPKLLAAHGIDAPPATWADLLSATKKFSGSGSYGYGFVSSTPFSMAYESVGPYMKTADGEFIAADGSKANAASSDGTVAAIKLIQSLVATGAVVPGASVTQDTLYQLFSQGKLAMFVSGSWARAEITGLKPTFTYGNPWKTAAIPVPKSGDASASTTGGWYLGVFKNSKHKEAASKLLTFLLKHDVTLAAPEGFPALIKGLDSKPWAGDPFYDAFAAVLPKTSSPIPLVPNQPEILTEFQKAVLPVVLHPKTDVVKALKGFDDQVNNNILK